MKKKKLRSGYTTGACAAAAAKAAANLLINAERGIRDMEEIRSVEIPFPDGRRVSFKIHHSKLITDHPRLKARASVIKDAGDDPDVTNRVEIVAEVRIQNTEHRTQNTDRNNLCSELCALYFVLIKGGEGVGIVTKPGLPIPVGEHAINPVPRKMIREAVMEACAENEAQNSASSKNPSPLSKRPFAETRFGMGEGKGGGESPGSGFQAQNPVLEVIISVPGGKELARKTLNERLGIIEGISILGTTGIVKPVSSEAWTATITASMDVAEALGYDEIVLSAGRASERVHMKKCRFPEESYVMMGDYIEFSLLEAKRHGFKKIHLCAQWAKMLKIAMAIPQTHVRHGAIDIQKALEFLNDIGIHISPHPQFHTAREILDLIQIQEDLSKSLGNVCNAAKKYAEGITDGIPVTTHLVLYEGDFIVTSQ